MTNFPYDEFAKEYLSEICQNYGETISSADVKSERRQVDILFTPTKEVSASIETLGLLGKMIQNSCLLEIYRNAIQPEQIKECLSKLFDVQQNKIREAKREKVTQKSVELPMLWIITPTISPEILASFRAIPSQEWDMGIYFLADGLTTGIVAIHQLKVSRETLWLRILGRGKVQALAVEELQSLPENYLYREIVLELIYGLWQTLQINRQQSENLEREDEDILMSLRSIFRERLAQEKQEGIQEGIQTGIQAGIQEGIQEGIKQNLKSNIISILEKRFQVVPSQLINLINGLSDITQLQKLHIETISVNSLEDFQELIISNDD